MLVFTEELKGQRRVAALGEVLVVEEVGGAEKYGVAAGGGGRYAQQGGQVAVG